MDRKEFYFLFEKLKTFEIDYNFTHYIKINKNLSYYENANLIYNKTGMINFTLLDIYYSGKIIFLEKFNHIHIGMTFDNDYTFASLPSIVSILNSSNSSTFLHFHIGVPNDYRFSNIIMINSLKYKINNSSDFSFYNCKQGEIYFSKANPTFRGIGDYIRISLIDYVNNTDKVIILDSGDIFVNKDLNELFNINLGQAYFASSMDPSAGSKEACVCSPFFCNYLYINTGVVLINIPTWKKDQLYKKAFMTSRTFKYFLVLFKIFFLILAIII